MIQNMIFNAIILIARIIGLSSVLPQIILNYKSQSTKGLSNIFLFAYLAGYAVELLYVYGLGLPIAYKIMTPVAFLLVLILVFQRFFYNKYKAIFCSFISYWAFLLLFFLAIILAIESPYKIGNLAGWISLLIWLVYPLPQMFRIYSKKSVEGFSRAFILLTAIGNSLELLMVLVLRLPIQSIFVMVRGLVFCAIFYSQFWMYKKR